MRSFWVVSELLRCVVVSVLMVEATFASSWQPIQTAPGTAAGSGWQYVTCTGGSGSGWQSCENPVKIVLTANPASLAAVGEVGSITATVTDIYDSPLPNVTLNWSSTDGALSAASSVTDSRGNSGNQIRSSVMIGGATITAIANEPGGTGSIFVPFVDKWLAAPSVFTAWAEYGNAYNCTGWTPDPSTVGAGVSFVQTATCTQSYIQYRQDREQSAVTGQIRNVGAPVPLYTSQSVTVSQNNVGTKAEPAQPTQVCFDNSDHIYEYLNQKPTQTILKLAIQSADGSDTYIGYYKGKTDPITEGLNQFMFPPLENFVINMDEKGLNSYIESNKIQIIVRGTNGGVYRLYDLHVGFDEYRQKEIMDYSGLCVITEPKQ